MRKFNAETIGSITGAGSVLVALGVYGYGTVLSLGGGTIPFAGSHIEGSLAHAAFWMVAAILPLLAAAALVSFGVTAALAPLVAEGPASPVRIERRPVDVTPANDAGTVARTPQDAFGTHAIA